MKEFYILLKGHRYTSMIAENPNQVENTLANSGNCVHNVVIIEATETNGAYLGTRSFAPLFS